MKARLLIVLLFSILIIDTGCNKNDDDSWTFCEGCAIEKWVGLYDGSGDFFNYNNDEMSNAIPTTVDITNTSDNILKISVVSEDYYSGSFNKIKDDDSYNIEIPGSSQSLSLSLSQKSDACKVTGTIKRYHYEKDSLIMDYTLSFEAERYF